MSTEEWMEIWVLHREGHSIKQIARLTGRSRNAVRRALRGGPPGAGKRVSPRPSKLDLFKPYLRERFEASGLSAVRLLPEVAAMGYGGSLQTVRRFLDELRVPKTKLTVRFETPPGKQAQADWGYCGRFPDAGGVLVSIYAFVMVLCFSRVLFVAFTTSMKLPELLRCHQTVLLLLVGTLAARGDESGLGVGADAAVGVRVVWREAGRAGEGRGRVRTPVHDDGPSRDAVPSDERGGRRHMARGIRAVRERRRVPGGERVGLPAAQAPRAGGAGFGTRAELQRLPVVSAGCWAVHASRSSRSARWSKPPHVRFGQSRVPN